MQAITSALRNPVSIVCSPLEEKEQNTLIIKIAEYIKE